MLPSVYFSTQAAVFLPLTLMQFLVEQESGEQRRLVRLPSVFGILPKCRQRL